MGLKLSKVQTDHSYFHAKKQLRLHFLPRKKRLRILDCFAGQQKLWNAIQDERPNIKFDIDRIEKRTMDGIYMRGDTRKYLPTIDLTKYDIIDLASYGQPIDQLAMILQRSKGRHIFITFIQSDMGQLSYRMLKELGYTYGMIQKCPLLFSKDGHQKFFQWLALHSIDKVNYILKKNKLYCHIYSN